MTKYKFEGSVNAGIIGDNATLIAESVFGNTADEKQYVAIAAELQRLKDHISSFDDPDNQARATSVAGAQSATKAKDANGLAQHLKDLGQWGLAQATAIGIPIVTALVRRSLGL